MVSPQDDIMRVFGGDKMFSMFNTIAASLPDDEPLMQSGLLTKRITTVQQQVEGRNFDVRKHVLEYDDVLDQHRRVIYKRRSKILETFDNAEIDNAEIDKVIESIIQKEGVKLAGISLDEDGDFDIKKAEVLTSEYVPGAYIQLKSGNITELSSEIAEIFRTKLTNLKEEFADRNFDKFQRGVYLSSVDQLWMSHIDRMTGLREEVAFAGYAQKNPLIEYKDQSYSLFLKLLDAIDHRVIRGILSARAKTEVEQKQINLSDLKGALQ